MSAPAAAQAPAPCFQFAQLGTCAYGERCRFAHGDGGGGNGCANAPSLRAAPASASAPRAAGSSRAASAKVVLFVAGLPACARGPGVRRALRQAFAPFRPATLRLGMTHAALTRGWGHVTMTDRASAEAAVAALDGAHLSFGGVGNGEDALVFTLHVAEVTGKQDSLFPYATRAQRLALQLDAVALQCCADAAFGERSAALLSALMRLATRPGARSAAGDAAAAHTWRVTDGCACAGGSAFAFARCADVTAVTAVEFDAARATALAHNAAVLGLSARVETVCGDYVQLAPQLPPCDVLFMDPPWGGAGYSKADIAADALGLSDVPLGALAAAAAARGTAAVALATPRNYDDTELARTATRRAPGATRHADRPLPFRAEFGARRLVLLLYPPASSADTAKTQRFAFPTALLDNLVAAAVAWNASFGAEHHVRFFDWEKDAWVPLSRWHGAKPVAPDAADARTHGAAL